MKNLKKMLEESNINLKKLKIENKLKNSLTQNCFESKINKIFQKDNKTDKPIVKALQFCENNGNLPLFSFNYKINGRGVKFHCISYFYFWEYYKNCLENINRHYYEVIKKDSYCNFHVDAEYYKQYVIYIDEKKIKKSFIKYIKEFLINEINTKYNKNLTNNMINCYTSNSSNKKKSSFHFVFRIQNHCFNTNEDVGNLSRKLWLQIRREEEKVCLDGYNNGNNNNILSKTCSRHPLFYWSNYFSKKLEILLNNNNDNDNDNDNKNKDDLLNSLNELKLICIERQKGFEKQLKRPSFFFIMDYKYNKKIIYGSYLDMGIYTSNRNFRILWSSKILDPTRILRPFISKKKLNEIKSDPKTKLRDLFFNNLVSYFEPNYKFKNVIVFNDPHPYYPRTLKFENYDYKDDKIIKDYLSFSMISKNKIKKRKITNYNSSVSLLSSSSSNNIAMNQNNKLIEWNKNKYRKLATSNNEKEIKIHYEKFENDLLTGLNILPNLHKQNIPPYQKKIKQFNINKNELKKKKNNLDLLITSLWKEINQMIRKLLENIQIKNIKITQYGYLYIETNSKLCEFIDYRNSKEHKSNHVYYIVDLFFKNYYQKCFDELHKERKGKKNVIPNNYYEIINQFLELKYPKNLDLFCNVLPHLK